MWRYFTAAVCMTGALVSVAAGQTPAPLAPPPTFVNMSGISNDYQVGPGDLLDIQIVDHADLNQTVRVSNSGDISFSMAGLIPVTDMTVFEIEAAIADRLKEKQLLQEAEVLVSVSEYQAKPIYVSGAVVNPGQFTMSQELTASDAILLAGGLLFNASDEGLLHRRVSAEGRTWSTSAVAETPDVPKPGIEIIKLNLQPLKEGRFLESAIQLRRGDVLVVPERTMNAFYVIGAVIDPRNFFYPPGKTLTASQAISWAGGPVQTAKMSEGMLVRYDAQGRRTEMRVDYAAILQGRQQDFPIQANDVIFIPGSIVKTISQGLLVLTDSMTMQAAFRIGRTYQLPDSADLPDRQPR